MPRNAVWLAVCHLVLIAALSSLGCSTGGTTQSTVSTSLGNREIQAVVDGSASISSQGDRAVVSFADGKIEITEDSIQHNGQQIANITEDVAKIRIEISDRVLTIFAGDEMIHTSKLAE